MCQTIARNWARFLITFSGIKITVSGLENIPKKQPVIFASNHQGAADILLCLALIPANFRFAIKKELFKIPLFGWALKKCGYFVIDRGSILIFPEGTRSRNGALGPFKQASLLAAPKAGVPVVPIAISGSYSILQRGSWVFERHPIKFSVGKPIKIASEDEYVKKLEEIRDAIARML
jgi:1-acyl-sn-glycerol-3-phosphate acyltransferase